MHAAVLRRRGIADYSERIRNLPILIHSLVLVLLGMGGDSTIASLKNQSLHLCFWRNFLARLRVLDSTPSARCVLQARPIILQHTLQHAFENA